MSKEKLKEIVVVSKEFRKLVSLMKILKVTVRSLILSWK